MTKKQEKVQRHPSTERLFRGAAERFMAERTRVNEARDLMQTTMLARFSGVELKLLGACGYLSEYDAMLLKRIGRKSSWLERKSQ